MQVKSFMTKVTMDAIREMDDSINDWLEKNNIEPKFVTQAIGGDQGRENRPSERLIVISVWY
ncbi:MAG: hypothetical protein WD873_06155 [Candidatus Hydrogenedentales bacterium]